MGTNKTKCETCRHRDHAAGECENCNCGESEMIYRKSNLWTTGEDYHFCLTTQENGDKVRAKRGAE